MKFDLFDTKLVDSLIYFGKCIEVELFLMNAGSNSPLELKLIYSVKLMLNSTRYTLFVMANL